MNFLSRIFGFLADLFSKSRKGFDSWLKTNLPIIKAFVKSFIDANADKKFAELKPLIFAAVKTQFPIVPDTWLSIAIDWAYEHLKAAADSALVEEAKADQKFNDERG